MLPIFNLFIDKCINIQRHFDTVYLTRHTTTGDVTSLFGTTRPPSSVFLTLYTRASNNQQITKFFSLSLQVGIWVVVQIWHWNCEFYYVTTADQNKHRDPLLTNFYTAQALKSHQTGEWVGQNDLHQFNNYITYTREVEEDNRTLKTDFITRGH